MNSEATRPSGGPVEGQRWLRGKVCVLTTVHRPDDTRIYRREIGSLVDAGLEVALIAPHCEGFRSEGIRYATLGKPLGRAGRLFILGWRAYRQALEETADVVHLHDPELILLGLLLKLRGRRVVYDVHEDVPRQIMTKHWIPSGLRRPLAWVFDLLERWAGRRFDGVIAATESIACRFPRATVVHNYPSPASFSPSEERDAGRARWLVYVGGVSRLRGVVQMVEALEHVQPTLDARLDLVGLPQPRSLYEELRHLPGFQRVHVRGWMPWEDAWQLAFREGAVGLLLYQPAPNHVASLPTKLFEYMAAGLPVIASHFPLWRGIVEGNECGFIVDPRDPEQIAAAIEYLLSHPEEARRMGENGRRAVSERYNWEREKHKLLELYEEVLGARS
jgi:glycosyltransferase involved in cell wall biosynthesis